MFSKLILLAIVSGIVPTGVEGRSATDSTQVPTKTETPRSFHQINTQMRLAMRREATEKNPVAWATTVVELTGLYEAIKTDPRLATSRTLEAYRAKLRHRLLQIKKRLQRDLAHHETGHQGSGNGIAYLACRTVEQQLVSQAALACAGFAGPSVAFGLPDRVLAGRRGGAARTDYGPALVDLIQRTIAPEFWNVNGGPGSIAYYPLWYALVVRATGEIHGRVSHLKRDLKR